MLFRSNSTAGTAKEAVDTLRKSGIKAGLIKPRVFRPLPYEDLPKDLKHLKALAIMDKCDSINGYGAPLFMELTSAMYSNGLTVPTINYIYGLGGVDVKVNDIISIYDRLSKLAKNGIVDNKTTYYLGYDE